MIRLPRAYLLTVRNDIVESPGFINRRKHMILAACQDQNGQRDFWQQRFHHLAPLFQPIYQAPSKLLLGTIGNCRFDTDSRRKAQAHYSIAQTYRQHYHNFNLRLRSQTELSAYEGQPTPMSERMCSLFVPVAFSQTSRRFGRTTRRSRT